jgi:hypothetical protein
MNLTELFPVNLLLGIVLSHTALLGQATPDAPEDEVVAVA